MWHLEDNVILSLGILSQVSRALHNWSWSAELKICHCRTFESWQDSYQECSKERSGGGGGSQERSLGWAWSMITWRMLVERNRHKSTLQVSLLSRGSMTADSHGPAWGGMGHHTRVTREVLVGETSVLQRGFIRESCCVEQGWGPERQEPSVTGDRCGLGLLLSLWCV